MQIRNCVLKIYTDIYENYHFVVTGSLWHMSHDRSLSRGGPGPRRVGAAGWWGCLRGGGGRARGGRGDEGLFPHEDRPPAN